MGGGGGGGGGNFTDLTVSYGAPTLGSSVLYIHTVLISVWCTHVVQNILRLGTSSSLLTAGSRHLNPIMLLVVNFANTK